MDCWRLPGPNNFIVRAINALREGLNLILATPSHGVANLPETLRRNLADDGWSVAEISDDESSNPLDLLYGSLNIPDSEMTRRSVTALRDRLDPGQVVLVRKINNTHWRDWRQFMVDYEAASRSVPRFERPLIVAVIEGVPISSIGSSAAALKSFSWQNVVGELDVLLYTQEVMRNQQQKSGREKLLSRVVARLALWDFDLAEQLIACDERLLFDPINALQWAANAMGETCRWRQGTWESGGRIQFDGIELDHSFLLLAQEAKHDILKRRLWEAQAGEILPLLELQRHFWAERIKLLVRFPIRLADQVYNDIDELEIGQLAYLAKSSNLRQSIRQSTDKLRRYRNKLAHMEALDYSEAFDPELCPK